MMNPMGINVGGFEIVGEGPDASIQPKGVGATDPKAMAVYQAQPKLVENRTPNQAFRQQLPLPITLVPKGATILVTARTQRAFRPDRLTIQSSAGAASVVVIGQFNVGAEPQFAAAGSLPVQMFAPTSFDNYIRGSTAWPGIEITLSFTHTAPAGTDETISGGFQGETIVL